MCGIAGIFNYRDPERSVDRAALERATRAIAHRGPDGEGFHVDGPVGLGHRRLAIVDLTPTGAQPMSNEDRSCWIVYNGEFYDHARFRPGLEERHQFRGRSDTETLLHLLEEKGPDGLLPVNAIFGLAFWEEKVRTLTLARDHLGVKQVYFHDDGRRVIFASEIKALFSFGIPRDLDMQGMNQYLRFHAPLFERTFFRNVGQLRPGEWKSWTIGGRKGTGRFWDLHNFEEETGGPEEIRGRLTETLSRVVADQLMSDVPVGSFFSGGIDSSAIAAFAARAGQAPRCFGVHFSGQGVIDERPYQEEAARQLGLRLELITMDGSSFPGDLTRLIWQQDQPIIGPALLPMFYVSRLAARSVKVCLGGQAADEVFGGYARYGLAHPLQAFLSLFRGAAKAGKTPSGSESPVGGNLRKQVLETENLRRVATNALHIGDWKELYFSHFMKVPGRMWKEVFSAPDMVSQEELRSTFIDTVERSGAVDRATKLMHWDLQTFLPGLFQQDDRMSMAVGLETRVPFADKRVVELAFRIPFAMKARAGATKWILRKVVADVLPEWVINRRKVGFDTPVKKWMTGEHKGFVREVLTSRPARERGLWNARQVEHWLGMPGHPQWLDVVWKILCIELWAQAYLDSGGYRQVDQGPRDYLNVRLDTESVGKVENGAGGFQGGEKPSLSHYFHTIRYMKLRQVIGQVRRLVTATPTSPAAARKTKQRNTKAGRLSLMPVAPAHPTLEGKRFTFLNHSMTFNASVDYGYTGLGKLWNYNLGYFDYLHQPGMDSGTALKMMRGFVESGNKQNALEPYPISLRLVNWIKFLVLRRVDDARIEESIAEQAALLEQNLETFLLGNHYFENGAALLFSGAYLRDARCFEKGAGIVRRELKEQILSDGGHFELSPMYHAIVLSRVLDCVNLLSGLPSVTPALKKECEERAGRMLGWLRQVRFANGDLPLVNDSSSGVAPEVEELFAYAGRLGVAEQRVPLRESGYRMVREGAFELFVDVGNIGPDHQPAHAHSDTLSFLLHLRGVPVLVDSGVSTYESGSRRLWERSTEAHNTVKVGGIDQSEIWANFRVARRAYIVRLEEKPGSIAASHDGYQRIGASHRRVFEYSGEKLRIRDNVEGAKDKLREAFFHLHHGITPEVQGDRVVAGPVGIRFFGAGTVDVQDCQHAETYNRLDRACRLRVTFPDELVTEIAT